MVCRTTVRYTEMLYGMVTVSKTTLPNFWYIENQKIWYDFSIVFCHIITFSTVYDMTLTVRYTVPNHPSHEGYIL